MTGPSGELRGLIERALAEDAPSGDLTTELTIPQDADCTAELRAKVRGVLAGVAAAQAVFDVVASQDGQLVFVQRHRAGMASRGRRRCGNGWHPPALPATCPLCANFPTGDFVALLPEGLLA